MRKLVDIKIIRMVFKAHGRETSSLDFKGFALKGCPMDDNTYDIPTYDWNIALNEIYLNTGLGSYVLDYFYTGELSHSDTEKIKEGMKETVRAKLLKELEEVTSNYNLMLDLLK